MSIIGDTRPSSRAFLMLVYDIRLEDVRAALEALSAKSQKPARADAPTVSDRASLIDFANFATIPRVFTTPEEHPKNTNLLCWHCCMMFTSVPRFIALESSRDSQSSARALTWTIDGNFCSWPCASAYINGHFADPRRWSLQQNLATVRAQFDGVRVRAVNPAPDRIKICLYSGPDGISQHAFAEQIANLSVVSD